MKKIIFILFFFLGSITPALAKDSSSLEDVLNKIIAEQDGKKISEVDCQKVAEERFEELGDAVMGLMHPDEKEHELMDQMMGGEGSQSLKAMHILMGEKYLGCAGNETGAVMSMMSMPAMMSGGSWGMGNMMGWNNWGMSGGWSWPGWILMVLFWVLITVGIIFLVKCLIWGCPPRGETKKSALEILKERYAKGDVSKEEFEEKKKDLI